MSKTTADWVQVVLGTLRWGFRDTGGLYVLGSVAIRLQN